MNKMTLMVLPMLAAGALGLAASPGVWGGEGRRGMTADVAPVADPEYQTECGGCHLPYQPGLLPARSWEALMGGLADHFGDNAELDPAVTARLRLYLTTHAADRASYGRSPGIARSVPPTAAPLRITETAYFRGKHHELSPAAVEENPQVKSFSACQACHTGAERGSYNEHEVRIPGVGRWED